MIEKKIKLLTILLIIFYLLISCEKDLDYPQKYIFNSFQNGNIKAFTNTGEIFDEITINKVIEGYENIFWTNGYELNEWKVEIEIISDSKAKISYIDTVIYYNLININGIKYFQSQDTILCQEILPNNRFQYAPLYTDIISFSQPLSAYVPCIYLIESNRELHLPLISYIEKYYVNNTGILYEMGKKNYNNVLNPTFLENIQNTMNDIDTIVYQENKVIFKEI